MILSSALTHITLGSEVTATDYLGREVQGPIIGIDRCFEYVMFYTVRLPVDPSTPWEIPTVQIWPECDRISLTN